LIFSNLSQTTTLAEPQQAVHTTKPSIIIYQHPVLIHLREAIVEPSHGELWREKQDAHESSAKLASAKATFDWQAIFLIVAFCRMLHPT